jgi:hypothetical protein
MDARWGDFGERGHVEIRSRPSEPLVEDYPPLAASASGSSIREELDAFDREIEEHTFAHGVVARAGGYVAGDWEYGSSRADRELLQAVRPASWSADAWEFLVTNRTRRLVRSESFRQLHQRIVAALEEMGDLGVLSGDELRQVLEPATWGVPGPRPTRPPQTVRS